MFSQRTELRNSDAPIELIRRLLGHLLVEADAGCGDTDASHPARTRPDLPAERRAPSKGGILKPLLHTQIESIRQIGPTIHWARSTLQTVQNGL